MVIPVSNICIGITATGTTLTSTSIAGLLDKGLIVSNKGKGTYFLLRNKYNSDDMCFFSVDYNGVKLCLGHVICDPLSC